MRRVVAGLVLTAVACGEPTSEYYRHGRVDPTTLLVTLEGGSPDGAGWRYFRFRDARGRQSVSETLVDAGERVLACRDYFSLDPEFRLLYRSKQQEIWRGEFGLILAATTYYYGPDYAGQPTGFETVPNANHGCAERPVELQSPPTSPGRLDGVSVVLISATGSSLAVVTANYDALRSQPPRQTGQDGRGPDVAGPVALVHRNRRRASPGAARRCPIVRHPLAGRRHRQPPGQILERRH